MPRRRIIGPVHAKTVALPRLNSREVHVPHESIHFGHLYAAFGEIFAYEAELDLVGDF